MHRRTLLGRALAAATVGLAGCTGGDGGTDTSTGTPTDATGMGDGGTDTATPTGEPTDAQSPTAESTDTPSPTAESTDTPASTATTTATADQEVVVGPGGALRFDPETFTVSAGDTVLWVWDSSGHNVSPDDGGQPDGADWPGEDDATYGADHEYAYTFEVPGEYGYHCDPHRTAGMTGSFTVEE